MSVRISYFFRNKQEWRYIFLPEGLKNKAMLREWIWKYDIPEQEKRSAYRAAKVKYDKYDAEFWSEEESDDNK